MYICFLLTNCFLFHRTPRPEESNEVAGYFKTERFHISVFRPSQAFPNIGSYSKIQCFHLFFIPRNLSVELRYTLYMVGWGFPICNLSPSKIGTEATADSMCDTIAILTSTQRQPSLLYALCPFLY